LTTTAERDLNKELRTGLTQWRPERTIGLVSYRIRTFIAFAILVAVGFGADEMSSMTSAAAAMACCAKTDYSCAGLSAPDTCCQRMHHAASHSTPSTAAATQAIDGALVIAALPPTLLVRSTSAWTRVNVEFTRPHDPPHLHTYSLLI
jgi:hypothetical protein